MSEKTYTYVAQLGNNILSRGYHKDGSRFNHKEAFAPTLFVSSKPNASKEEAWTDLFGKKFYPVKPGNIRDCKDFMEKYDGVEGFTVTGMTNWVAQYISEEYPGEVIARPQFTRINIIDIETSTEEGFPDIATANEEILLITKWDSIHDRFIVYTSRDVDFNSIKGILSENKVDIDKVVISKQADEYHLLRTFVMDWALDCPDIVSGWHSQLFDIPYLVRRIERILGESYVSRLSPWGIVRETSVTINEEEKIAYTILGINILDYLDLFKKYTYGGRESWKLDNIAKEELGMSKLPFDGSFKEHYTKAWNHFVAYNIIDVSLVKLIDKKHRFFDLALTIAYDSKVVPDEVFSQIRSWDSLIFNELNTKKIVVPPNKKSRREQFEGAYVKDPIIGKHRWVVSFDLQSLYPHIMMWANLSPETMVPYNKNVTVDALLAMKYDNSDLVHNQYSMTANGVCYRKDQRGFIADIVSRIYNDRSKFKKMMLALEQDYANTKDESLLSEIARLNNLQLARKIQINSVYGAMGSPYFRYYDLRMAEGITTSGQLAIRWVSNDINKFLNKACGSKDVDYCIYNDTDSGYFTLETLVNQKWKDKTDLEIVATIDKFCSEVLQTVINKSYERLADYMNAYEQKLIMKREVIADVGVFVAKKRYALSVWNSEGVQYKEQKIKVTGLDLVRSSTPAVIRDVLKQGVKEVLYKSQNDVQEFIQKYKAAHLTLDVSQISFPRGVNGLKTYAGSPIYEKGCPMQVRAALLYNHYVKRLGLADRYPMITDGNKIKFVYLKMPNPFHENVIGYIDKLPPEFGLEDYIDYKTMFEKSFEAPMQSLITPLGWTTEEKASLEDLFS
jgi:DNA polymerase elongation subunit (family B)